jgi:outer membrane protein assembly factor BamA
MLLLAESLGAQTAPATRVAEIEAQRDRKEAALKPDTVSPTEERLRRLRDEKWIERFSQGFNGLRLRLGNLVTGSGFALGPEYFRGDLAGGNLEFRAGASFSFSAYQKYDVALTAPRLLRGKLFTQIYSVHHNYPRMNYFGPGPDSVRPGRSNYRLEDTALDGTVAFRANPKATLGATGGVLWMNIGPGTDRRFISTEKAFTPQQTPGIDVQTDFWRIGGFGLLNYLDQQNGPRDGGYYLLAYDLYRDRKLGRHDFNQFTADLQQYFGFFNDRRVIALRGKTVLTDPLSAQVVPFYLQPILGGGDDLRGFRPFRFYGNQMLVMNTEYRWEAFPGLDAALFYDTGKVFDRVADLNWRGLEHSWGFGLRFNARNSTFLRIDVGWSREGFGVWFKFNEAFARRRYGTSSAQPIF